MKKILVAVDGSPSSEKALVAAVHLAQRDSGQLTAVAVHDCGGDPELEGLAEGVTGQARLRLEEVLGAAVNFARSRGVGLTPLFREGHPGEAIVTCAEKEGADLVVVGARGKQAGGGLGGTADRVSSNAHCTVLLVK